MKKLLIFFMMLVVMVYTGFAFCSSFSENTEMMAKIELLESWIKAQMEYRGLPGLAIAVVYDHEIVWTNGFGFSDVEHGVMTTPKTIYRIASITKVFTSTAIIQLRDQGKLRRTFHIQGILFHP